MADNVATVGVNLDTSAAEKKAAQFFNGLESRQINVRLNSLPLGQINSDLSQITKSLDAANARVIAFGASVGILGAIGRSFRDLVTDTVAVEKALTDINVLINTSTANIQKFGAELFNVARDAAAPFSAAATAAAEFARQGLKMEEILRRTSDALVLARISGLDLSRSIDGLTATVNGFQRAGLTTTEVVNKLANVDAAFAVSTKDLIEGLTRSSAVAQDAKVSFDELSALIAALQQNTARGGSIIGNALKSIFTRIERPQVLEDLQQLGIATKDVTGASLSAIDVLANLAKTYDKLGESQKSAVSEQVGGVFQINLLKAALKDLGSGYSVYSQALKTSLESTNEAITRNQELNKTLAALAARTGTSAVQAGAAIGNVAVRPAVENVLGLANNALQGITQTIDGKGIGGQIGGSIATAILDVIGQTLSGPGLVVIGALIVKLTANIAGSLRQAFESISAQNSASEQQAELQSQIVNQLSKEPQLYADIASGANSVLSVERQILEATELTNNQLRARAALAASISSSAFGAGLRGVELNVGGGITSVGAPKAAGGLIPDEAEKERSLAREGGYNAGTVKSTEIPRLGRVVYNTAEQIKQFPGFDQPAIMPPAGSKAANNYEKFFKGKYGFNPYAGQGYIPNYAIEDHFDDPLFDAEANMSRGILETSADLAAKKRNLKIGYLSSDNKNPLFELVSKLKKNELDHIDAGAVVGPRIPSLLASLIDQRKSGKLGDSEKSPVNLTGFFYPQELLDKAQTLSKSRGVSLNQRVDDRQFEKMNSAFSKLGVDQSFFRGGEQEGQPFRFDYTVAGGFVPNYASPLGDFLNVFGGATTPENAGLAKIASRSTRGAAIRNIVGLYEPQLPENILGGDLKRLLANVSPETLKKLVGSGALRGVSDDHVNMLDIAGGSPNFAIDDLDINSRQSLTGKYFADASLGDDPVGNINATLKKNYAAITDIKVGEDYRGKGVSNQLYEKLIQDVIGGDRQQLKGKLLTNDPMGNSLKSSFPQISRAKYGKFSELDLGKQLGSFRIRSEFYDNDIQYAEKKLKDRQQFYGASFPTLTTNFAEGLLPDDETDYFNRGANDGRPDKGHKRLLDLLKRRQKVNPLGTVYQDIDSQNQLGRNIRFGGTGFVPNYADAEDILYKIIKNRTSGMQVGAFKQGKPNDPIGLLDTSLDAPNEYNVDSISVNHDFQGKGISSKLYQTLAPLLFDRANESGQAQRLSGTLAPQGYKRNPTSIKGVFPQLSRANLPDTASLLRLGNRSYNVTGGNTGEISDDYDVQELLKELPTLTTVFKPQRNAGRGYVPNFNIGDAMLRERDALYAQGYTPKQVSNNVVYAPSSELPNGGVYNRLQEGSITDGINASKKAGINPLTKGFTPNFADDSISSRDLQTILSQSSTAFRAKNPDLLTGAAAQPNDSGLTSKLIDAISKLSTDLRAVGTDKQINSSIADVRQQGIFRPQGISDPQSIGAPLPRNVDNTISLKVEQQKQLNPDALAVIPNSPAKSITELGQALNAFKLTTEQVSGGLATLTEKEQEFIRTRISEGEAMSLSTNLLQKRIQVEQGNAQAQEQIAEAVKNARNFAVNGGLSRSAADLALERQTQGGAALSSIFQNQGTRFRGNEEGAQAFQQQQAGRLDRAADLAQRTGQTFRPDTRGITLFEDAITKARLAVSDFGRKAGEVANQSPIGRGAGELGRAAGGVVGGIGNFLNRNQLPLIFGSEAITAGARQAFGANSGVTAGAEAVSSSLGIGAIIAGINPVVGAISTLAIASYKLVDAFSGASIRLREIDSQLEIKKGKAQETQDTSQAFLQSRAQLEEGIGRGAGSVEISRLSRKDQEAFSKLDVGVQSKIAGVTDPKEIAKAIQEELEKNQKELVDLTTQRNIIDTRKVTGSNFAGVDREGNVREVSQGYSPVIQAFGEIGKLLRNNGGAANTNFDGSREGEARLASTAASIRQVISPEALNKQVASGQIRDTLSRGFDFDGKDLDALVGRLKQLSQISKQNEEVLNRQNQRLVENSRIQNAASAAIDLYNKTLISNAQSLNLAAQASISRQRAGNQIVSIQQTGAEEIREAAVKRNIDLGANVGGVSDSARAALDEQASIRAIQNQRSLGIQNLLSGISPDTQEHLTSGITGITGLAQSLNAKQLLQSNDAQAAAEVSGNPLAAKQEESKESTRLLQPILSELAETLKNSRPQDAVGQIQRVIDQTRTQQAQAISPDVKNQLNELANKLQAEQNAIAVGFVQLNTTSEKLLQEAITNNAYTQRLIELNRNRAAAGGFEGFTDFAKRISGLTDGISSFQQAFSALNQPNAFGGNSPQASEGRALQIGQATKFIQAAAQFSGNSKPEIDENLAGVLTQNNQLSINAAARQGLTQLSQVTNAPGQGLNDQQASRVIDGLGSFIDEYKKTQSARDSISEKLLDSRIDSGTKQGLEGQNDALARQQQDIFSRALAQNKGIVGNTGDPALQALGDNGLRSILQTVISSSRIARDQVTGANTIIGAEKPLQRRIEDLNSPVETGRETVKELRNLSSIVLTNSSAEKFIGEVTAVGTQSYLLEQQINKNVELIRALSEKNTAQARIETVEQTATNTDKDLGGQIKNSKTFQALHNADTEGFTEDFKSTDLFTRLRDARRDPRQQLNVIQDTAENIRAGNTLGQTAARQAGLGEEEGKKSQAEVVEDLLKAVAKGTGTEVKGAEKNILSNISVSSTELDKLNGQLFTLKQNLIPVVEKFDAINKQAQSLTGQGIGQARASIVNSVQGGSPEEIADRQDKVRALLSDLDSKQANAEKLATAATANGARPEDKNAATTANSELQLLRSKLPQQFRDLGVTSVGSVINFGTQSQGQNPTGANIPAQSRTTTVPVPESSPVFETRRDFEDSRKAFYNNLKPESIVPDVTGINRVKGYIEGPGASEDNRIPKRQEQNEAQEKTIRAAGIPDDQRTSKKSAVDGDEDIARLNKGLGDYTTAVNLNTEAIKAATTKPVGEANGATGQTPAASTVPLSITISIPINANGEIDKSAVEQIAIAKIKDAFSQLNLNVAFPPGRPNATNGEADQPA